jgi:hypothetical protein
MGSSHIGNSHLNNNLFDNCSLKEPNAQEALLKAATSSAQVFPALRSNIFISSEGVSEKHTV